MFNNIRKEHKIIFAVGAVAGAALISFLRTKSARELAVKGLANGIIAKDNIIEEITNIREEADDICNEAKAVAKADCESPEV